VFAVIVPSTLARTSTAMQDNSWLSETAKNIIVTTIMTFLIVGMAWGYYEAHKWRAERNVITEEIDEQSRERPSDH
jgi:predicted negative regulator of RcsB-dependent stress response